MRILVTSILFRCAFSACSLCMCCAMSCRRRQNEKEAFTPETSTLLCFFPSPSHFDIFSANPTHAHAHTNTHTRTRTHTHTHTHTNTNTHTRKHKHTYPHTHAHNVRTHDTNTHTHTHTYTHTQASKEASKHGAKVAVCKSP